MQKMFRFLSHIARIRLRMQDAEHIIFFLKKDIPWKELFVSAKTEGVAGLLYHHLDHLKLAPLLPKPVLKELQDNYIETSLNSLQVVAAIKALAVPLDHSGIDVIALQGLSVLRLYGDPGLRPLSDVDLMVREKDESRLKALLEERGYRKMSCEFNDLYCSTRIRLDLHTHILNLERIRTRQSLFPEDLGSMWKKALPFFDRPGSILLLDPYDNFIALAAHALKHGYSRLIWLCDLHEWLLEHALTLESWKNLVNRSRFWTQQRIVLYALLLVESVFDFKVPSRVKNELGCKKLSRLERYLLSQKAGGISLNTLCLVLWFYNIEGVKNKFRFIRETLFPRDEIMEQIFFKSAEKSRRARYKERIGNALRLVSEDIRLILASRK